jgi:predicted O-methyltransferase YrrM
MALRDVPRGKGWRYLSLLAKCLTGKGGGFFIPYRYAAGVELELPPPEPTRALCEQALPACGNVLNAMERYRKQLQRIEVSAAAPEPRWDQDWFSGLDAAAYYTLIRTHEPKRIVEIGSGHSTRFALRAIRDGGLGTIIHAIDPAPRAAIREDAGDSIHWHETTLQKLPASERPVLEAGDILFIDSSHILMPGTDVDVLLNDWLPRLPAGVLVHFHDIFLPLAYPSSWRWRGYNEQPAVSALLAAGGYTLMFGSILARQRLKDQLAPLDNLLHKPATAMESSLWLMKS